MARSMGWWGLGVLILLGAVAARAAETPRLNSTGFTSSQVCGACHQDIFAMWKGSKHARAFENPIFAAAYRDLQREGGDARRLCLRCHAPIAGITGDLEAQQAITREGVTCDFCHSVTGVAIRDTDSPFVVEVGGPKRGPKVGASSAAHAIQPSILHKSSRLCGGCHEFRNPEGLTTISTISEWRASSYPAELRACQDCHFLPVNGRSTIQTGNPVGSKIPDHRLQRSQEQLQEAVKLDLRRVTLNAGRLEVAVGIRNAGSGHAVPTGHPSRRLVLLCHKRWTSGAGCETMRAWPIHPVLQSAVSASISTVSDGRSVIRIAGTPCAAISPGCASPGSARASSRWRLGWIRDTSEPGISRCTTS